MKKLVLFTLLGILSLSASAQSESKFDFSGSVDTYYRTNFGADRMEAPNTSFANLPGFSLGMVNLVGSYTGEKVGFVADLVFGPRGEEAVFNSVGSSNIVNQLYAYWNVSNSVTLSLGNFNTFLGYEVISPVSNFNYSTSYMFSYGPFSHAGLKIDIALSEDLSLMLAVLNPTDYTEYNVNGTVTFGGQIGYKGQYLNVLYGDQTTEASMGSLFQIDYTGGFDLSEKFYLGINGTYNATPVEDSDATGFYGAAIYLQYAFNDKTALGLRPEYFSEFGEFGALGYSDASGKGNVFALTLSANYAVADGLKIIPELRYDMTSEASFSNGADMQKELGSFLLAAVYSF